MYHLHDPLLEIEKSHKKQKYIRSFLTTIKLISLYCFLTGVVFSILLAGLNVSAYSSRILHYIHPEILLQAKEEVNHVLSSSNVEVHASEGEYIEKQEDLESITSKILESDPEMIYAREYEPKGLISQIGQEKLKSTFKITPYENRIIIPRIGENIPLVDTKVEPGSSFETMHEVFMEDLRGGVVRYPGTALPGEVGNVFIFGHSSNYPWVKSKYNTVFALLDTLENGDEIIVYYNQKKYTYKVTDRAIVKPGDVKTLESRDPRKKELSLMTCWPIGTTLERIIIFAELVENL